MRAITRICATAMVVTLGMPIGAAYAGSFSDTLGVFQHSNQSGAYFTSAYGYAVFPTIGKGGLVVGAAHGTGRVYANARRIGHVSMTQISVGAQAGGEAYSEIIFFENKAALDEFTAGNFEFSGDVGATVITASASASAGTTGENSAASADNQLAATQGHYYHGMAVFTIAKGGLMYNAVVAGQKFSYEPYDKKVALQ
ncbi:MAG: lipid-binding SYLF domain-containing protein [Steroidobacteraceae bacterium]|jgi:lipid-binding SYLF domain-containing protein